ncbi:MULTISPECIES: molybdenum-dependent transcriptional regulator [unclassified Brenneria]|uniref:molybdenum-dependent transcriptional regulator n=1 Tax=unclassified Brenneria TaxID=2634434 RepID=UPI0015572E4B|nr:MULTISPECIES: molybdenum-dependent transcriptional regulator [unclassified Brenneria]MBJ7221630.1 molybdenum-dependent transcriptional regulator [Brenneria sp. L3-3C-1]MEE3642872.1 molybdenum-dependent transcriptional regulator [Brenneria sp. L3_3C_1]MEE3650942.1 molybdenum-dependent transcriptional regulator [Brenneria sp. HEZEL_4_2_4]NPD00898.1 molybdenum-dependent transcriptional regulator [Brenneria sp. hezel4-2-4]
MQAEILLTLKLQQRLFADPRRIDLLKQVRHTGSISQGAKLAGISYKSAWDAINEMNQLAEQTLVERMTGGKGGGGARLTRYGERLIQLYDLMAQIQQKAFDVLQEDDLPLDSLLAAIARFSLQTSARNQFFGTVLARDDGQVQQHVDILLADGKTSISALITQHSAERLQLKSGKEVLVLIKAPWVNVCAASSPATKADNRLQGRISSIQPGAENSEVLIALAGGETLCATVPNDVVSQQQLRRDQDVSAYFNADRVIIATLC